MTPVIAALLLFFAGTVHASAATMLFETDFGGTVNMGTPIIDTNCQSGWWPIQGGDDGFSWPLNINGGTSAGLQPISYGPCITYNSTTKTIDAADGSGPIWNAEIVQGVRHDGTTGAMLHQQNYQDILWQLPYVISPGSDVTDYYEKMWIKLPANLAQQMGPNDWRNIAEVKDTGFNDTTCPYPGWRMVVAVMTDANDNLYWDLDANSCDSSSFPSWFEKTSYTPVPAGQWFEFEWAWHRTHDNTSWAWVKINGNQILTQNGGGTNPNGFYGSVTYPIDRIMPFQLYGHGPSEQWIDHLEVWNGVPSSSDLTPLATTTSVTSSSSAPAATPSASLTPSTTNVTSGAPISVTFKNITAGSGDWVGFYPLGEPFDYPVSYQDPTAGATSGTLNFSAVTSTSSPAPAGSYEFRYYNAALALLATSPTITVTAPVIQATQEPAPTNPASVSNAQPATTNSVPSSPAPAPAATIAASSGGTSTNAPPVASASPIASAATTASSVSSNNVMTTADLNVRQSASLNAPIVGTEPAGSAGTVAGDMVAADGYTWRQVHYANGLSGWSIDEYLSSNSATASSVSPTSSEESQIALLEQLLVRLENLLQMLQTAHAAAGISSQ